MLSKAEYGSNLAWLFWRDVDWRTQQLHYCTWAFKNLALHIIEVTWPELFPLNIVRFDEVSLETMVRRFHRDAFGVRHFEKILGECVDDEPARTKLLAELMRLSVRINSPNPRRTRIAAAFSLWMATFRPLFILGKPPAGLKLWHLNALINFYLATEYLRCFGTIEVGINERDRKARYRRILYDFTCRDLNLSSLEMLYCSIFRPNPELMAAEEEAEMADAKRSGVEE